MRSSWYENARRQLGNERGATYALVGVCLVALLGAVALAVDVGMLYDTRTESQRASDAAALAGASALMDYSAPQDSVMAVARAINFAGQNRMRGTPVTPTEVQNVELIRPNSRVRVTIRRPAVPTIFARVFGIESVSVGTVSAARVAASGTVSCLKPFAVPDTAYSPNTFGQRRLVVDSRDDGFVLIGFGGGPPGGGSFHDDIRLKCNDRTARISLAQPMVWAKPSGGLPPGQIRNPFDDLYDSDPTLRYDASSGKFFRGTVEEPNWRASPRVGNVAVIDHTTIRHGETGTYQVKIVDFISVYFESPNQQCPPPVKDAYCSQASNTWVWGRFFPAIGEPDDCEVTGTCSPNSFRLRLVE
jgi:Flp pilus assembly protein TadG